MIDFQNELAEYVFKSKYARYVPELKRRETWDETVGRVEAMHLERYSYLPEEDLAEIRWAFDMVRQKMVLPSMRSMQFGGKAVLAHQARIYNCSVRIIDSSRAFAEVMYLLLCGCGVGIGVFKKYTERLPNLVNAKDKTGSVFVYTVEDNIEGWADSIEALLNCYFKNNPYSGKKIVFDYSKIRPAGAPLKTGGGKAPGYEPLKAAHQKIKKLLDYRIERKEAKRLRGIDIYDILMFCSDAVLAGGVRRSATIVVFDKDDKEMMGAKTLIDVDGRIFTGVSYYKHSRVTNQNEIRHKINVEYKGNVIECDLSDFEYQQLTKDKKISWLHVEPQRARSNNSVLLVRDQVTEEEFAQIIENTKLWGEPGFVFANVANAMPNPCVEIMFVPVTDDGQCGVQFCVAGNTRLMTKSDGLVDISSVVNKDIEIWNGENWSMVKPYQTGTNDELYRITFSDGSYLDATNNHKFLVKQQQHANFMELTTLELLNKIQNTKGAWFVPRANVNIDYNGNVNEYAYEYGFFVGDGHLDHGKPKLNLYNEDKNLGLRGDEYPKIYRNAHGTEYKTIALKDLDASLCQSLKAVSLPGWVSELDRASFLNFVAGWIDADGAKANNGCRLYGTEPRLRDLQILLSRVGVVASLNLFQPKGTGTNLGERKNDLWYLQIPNASKIPSRRLDLSKGKDARFKGKNQAVVSIEKLDGVHPSFCLTEEQKHQCVFNNVLTKQCNLTTINGGVVKDIETFKKCVKAATLIGTLQAGYTSFPYLSRAAQKLTEEEALLGVSITGILDSPEFFLNQDNLVLGSTHAVHVNEEWAKKIGIRPSARITCVKPEGSSTLVLKCFGSGAGPGHAKPKFLRRVQANKLENVYRHFRESNPHATEESVWSNTGTDDVISFPINVPENVMTKDDLTAIQHLDIIKMLQKCWVKPGTTEHNKKPITHSVSCTVVVKDNEWDRVIKHVYKNRNFFAAVSFIGELGDKAYPQAPNEKMVTEGDIIHFDELQKNWKAVDYDTLIEEEDMTEVQNAPACAGGVCQIT